MQSSTVAAVIVKLVGTFILIARNLINFMMKVNDFFRSTALDYHIVILKPSILNFEILININMQINCEDYLLSIGSLISYSLILFPCFK